MFCFFDLPTELQLEIAWYAHLDPKNWLPWSLISKDAQKLGYDTSLWNFRLIKPSEEKNITNPDHPRNQFKELLNTKYEHLCAHPNPATTAIYKELKDLSWHRRCSQARQDERKAGIILAFTGLRRLRCQQDGTPGFGSFGWSVCQLVNKHPALILVVLRTKALYSTLIQGDPSGDFACLVRHYPKEAISMLKTPEIWAAIAALPHYGNGKMCLMLIAKHHEIQLTWDKDSESNRDKLIEALECKIAAQQTLQEGVESPQANP